MGIYIIEGIDVNKPVSHTALFRSNRSQAVRLPKSVAFPDGVRDVRVIKEGKGRLVVPADAVWDDFFDAPGIDLPEREQVAAQARDAF